MLSGEGQHLFFDFIAIFVAAHEINPHARYFHAEGNCTDTAHATRSKVIYLSFAIRREICQLRSFKCEGAIESESELILVNGE